MIDITVEIFYRSLTDLPKNFLIITENIFFVKPFTDGRPTKRQSFDRPFHSEWITLSLSPDVQTD